MQYLFHNNTRETLKIVIVDICQIDYKYKKKSGYTPAQYLILFISVEASF